MASFNKFNCFVQDVGDKLHNLNSDTLKVMLTNTVPLATNAVLSDLTDIAAGNGYSAGGTAVGSTAYSQVAGLATLSGGNVIFTAAGGSIGPFRYAAIYNSTAAGKNLIGWWDYGSAVTLATGETFTVNLSSNILTLQ